MPALSRRWVADGPVHQTRAGGFGELCRVLLRCAALRSRKEATAALAAYFKQCVARDDAGSEGPLLLLAVKLAVGQLWPPWVAEANALHVGDAMVRSAAVRAAALVAREGGTTAADGSAADLAAEDERWAARLDELVASSGDVGEAVAALLREARARTDSPGSTQHRDELGLEDVVEGLKTLSRESGSESTARKQSLLAELLSRCGDGEAPLLVRMAQRGARLRIGLAERSVVAALAVATMPRGAVRAEEEAEAAAAAAAEVEGRGKEAREVRRRAKETARAAMDAASLWSSSVQAAYERCPDIERVCAAVLDVAAEHSDASAAAASLDAQVPVTLGIPARPMSAVPAASTAAAADRLCPAGAFVVEPKLDGERVQVHWRRGASVDSSLSRCFSRNGEDTTARFPDLLSGVAAAARGHVREAVLDGEAVAWDAAQGRVLPFAKLVSRRRKATDAGDEAAGERDGDANAAPAVMYAFDLLSLNGRSVVSLPLRERRALLADAFAFEDGVLSAVEADEIEGNDRTAAESKLSAALRDAMRRGQEGLMAKVLDGDDSAYVCGHRSVRWVKLKPDYAAGGGDTLDLVPVAAWRGKGKRGGGFGSFLMAARIDDGAAAGGDARGRFASVCRLGSGFADADLQRLSEWAADAAAGDAPPAWLDGSGAFRPRPDVWLHPRTVWEVKGAQLTRSPTHSAGVALRFPRFLRERHDKCVAPLPHDLPPQPPWLTPVAPNTPGCITGTSRTPRRWVRLRRCSRGRRETSLNPAGVRTTSEPRRC